MKLNIKVTNLTLLPESADYLNKKIASLDKFINPNNDSILVEVEVAKTTEHHKSGEVFRAEINMQIDGKSLYAFSEKESLHSAIDEMRDEILRELKSYKTKKRTLFRRGASRMKNIIKGLPGFRRWR